MTIETKTETMKKMPFPDQNPMVRSFIQSRRFGLVEEYHGMKAMDATAVDHYISTICKDVP